MTISNAQKYDLALGMARYMERAAEAGEVPGRVLSDCADVIEALAEEVSTLRGSPRLLPLGVGRWDAGNIAGLVDRLRHGACGERLDLSCFSDAFTALVVLSDDHRALLSSPLPVSVPEYVSDLLARIASNDR